MALNVQGSSGKALQWISDVLSAGDSVADAAVDSWMRMLEESGIPRYIVMMCNRCCVQNIDHGKSHTA